MTTTAPPPKLWVLLKSHDSAVVNHPTQVPTKDCDNVDDFIKAVKKELQLPQPPQEITLHTTEDAPALEPDDPLPAQNTKQTALAVTAPPSAAPSSGPLMKAGRQKTLKKMSVEASCRKFLDAVAVKLSSYYSFTWRHRDGPTIGDVIHAVFPSAQHDDEEDEEERSPLWSFQTEQKTYWRMDPNGFRMKIKKGAPRALVGLDKVFTDEEWSKLQDFNRKTTDRVHDGLLPTLSDGRPYIVLPHADYSPEMVEFLQTIGHKAHLLSDPSRLVVKDEDALSEGSSII